METDTLMAVKSRTLRITHMVTRKLIRDFGEENFSDRPFSRQRIQWENDIMLNMRKWNMNMK